MLFHGQYSEDNYILTLSMFLYFLPAKSARRAALPALFFYSRADLWVFRPTGATRCTDQGEIWLGGADLCPLLPAAIG